MTSNIATSSEATSAPWLASRAHLSASAQPWATKSIRSFSRMFSIRRSNCRDGIVDGTSISGVPRRSHAAINPGGTAWCAIPVENAIAATGTVARRSTYASHVRSSEKFIPIPLVSNSDCGSRNGVGSSNSVGEQPDMEAAVRDLGAVVFNSKRRAGSPTKSNTFIACSSSCRTPKF